MKNWIIAMFVMVCGMMIATTFTACDNDDDNGANITSEQLVGKWILTKTVWYDSREPQPDEYPSSGNSHYLQLNADGTGTVNPYNLFEAEIRGTFTWNISGNVLSINESDGNLEQFTVTSISSTNLELTWLDIWYDEGFTIREVSSFTKTTE